MPVSRREENLMEGKDQTFENAAISRTAVLSIFRNCELSFSGLRPFKLEGCAFDRCKWALAGPAANTVLFLAALYQEGGREMVEQVIGQIKGGSVPVRH